MDLLKYVDSQITSIRQTKIRYEKVIEDIKKKSASEYGTFGGILIKYDAEQIAANKVQAEATIIKQLYIELDKEIEKIIAETEATLALEKKKAIQEYAAAEPLPTTDDFNRIEQLKLDYGVRGDDGNIITGQFLIDMNFHIENETVFAFAYYLLAKKVMVRNPENEQMLQDIYLKLFPVIQKKADELKKVEDAINVFRSQVIIYKMDSNENLSFAESVAMKVELQSLGYYDRIQVTQ
ncbi:MAG: hypothetical protein J6D02_09300 [Lachnospira sp.]|nr:hypothetical protein [Lachnospira sp.]